MEIIPNKREKNMLVDGSRITGFSSSGLSDFIDVGTQNLEELQLILNTMSSVFGTKETSTALKDIVSSMKDAAANMEKIIRELSRISNSDRIANILKSPKYFLKNINETVSKDELKRLDEILLNLESFSVDLKDITGDGN